MKNNHLNNFIFLAVLIGVVLFSRSLYTGGHALLSTPGLADAGAAVSTSSGNKVPLFIMPTTVVSANRASSGTANSAKNNNGENGATPTPANQAPSAFVKTGDALPPGVSATSYLVADLETGAVFAGKAPASRWPTASLTKLMTATVADDMLASSTSITITEPMFAVDPTDETTLVVGGVYSVDGLMHALLMPSSNVAAEALADFYGRTQFMVEMNRRATAWGMKGTYFDDPSGLSASNQSTANDLLKLAQVIYQHYPDIFAVTRTPQVYIKEQNSGKAVLVRSINNYAGDADFVGGKTGNTPEANGNLLSVFMYDGHPLCIVVLGSTNGEVDLPSAFTDTNTLFRWFTANYQ